MPNAQVMFGILSGYGEAAAAREQKTLEDETKRRDAISKFWLDQAKREDLRPEARDVATKNYLAVVNTPMHKKLGKEVSSVDQFLNVPVAPGPGSPFWMGGKTQQEIPLMPSPIPSKLGGGTETHPAAPMSTTGPVPAPPPGFTVQAPAAFTPEEILQQTQQKASATIRGQYEAKFQAVDELVKRGIPLEQAQQIVGVRPQAPPRGAAAQLKEGTINGKPARAAWDPDTNTFTEVGTGKDVSTTFQPKPEGMGLDEEAFKTIFIPKKAQELGKTVEQLTEGDKAAAWEEFQKAKAVYGEPVLGAINPKTGKAEFTPRSEIAGREVPQFAALTEGQRVTLTQNLAKDWSLASKPAAELNRQVQIMKAGLAAAQRGDRAAGYQAVLVAFQKMIDPLSVVRESEFDRSAAGQALLNRAKGYLEQLEKGGAKMPIDELQRFARLGEEMAAAQNRGYLDGVKKRISKVANNYGIPLDQVFEPYLLPGMEPTPPVPTPPPSGFSVKVGTKTYTFKSQQDLDSFKREAGVP